MLTKSLKCKLARSIIIHTAIFDETVACSEKCDWMAYKSELSTPLKLSALQFGWQPYFILCYQLVLISSRESRKANAEQKRRLLIEEAAFFVDYVMQTRDRRRLLSMAGRCGPGIA